MQWCHLVDNWFHQVSVIFIRDVFRGAPWRNNKMQWCHLVESGLTRWHIYFHAVLLINSIGYFIFGPHA